MSSRNDELYQALIEPYQRLTDRVEKLESELERLSRINLNDLKLERLELEKTKTSIESLLQIVEEKMRLLRENSSNIAEQEAKRIASEIEIAIRNHAKEAAKEGALEGSKDAIKQAFKTELNQLNFETSMITDKVRQLAAVKKGLTIREFFERLIAALTWAFAIAVVSVVVILVYWTRVAAPFFETQTEAIRMAREYVDARPFMKKETLLDIDKAFEASLAAREQAAIQQTKLAELEQKAQAARQTAAESKASADAAEELALKQEKAKIDAKRALEAAQAASQAKE